MAIDGSFSLDSALERFLARCPKVGDLRHFESLSRKRNKVTEEEVVNSVAELSLHPHYTIPLIGCFRPIAQKIVDRAVDLLHLVSDDLRSNSDEQGEDSGYLGDAEVVAVIQFHVNSGSGFRLHELACLAFCRVLDLAPFLLESVLRYFKLAPPPFERLMKRTVPELSSRVVSHYLNAARISYRLLIIKTEIFSKLWDWSCFLDFVQKFGSLDFCSDAEFKNDIADIRWCGLQILSVILRTSDRAVVDFGVQAEESISCLLRWEEFCHDTSLEKAGSYIESSDKLGSRIGDLSFNQENCLHCFGLYSEVHSQVNEIEPSTRRRKLAIRDNKTRLVSEFRDNKSDGNPFVLTYTVKRSYEVVLLAVSQKWPVLLYGPTGSGKSALVNNLAKESGNQVLSIHMDDQIDGKTLIGSYVCMEQPGEFRWQPGSLTQAILNGYWVVFEDIDKAPSDVQSILLPLLEGASSFATGYAEEIRIPESFRLFSTISTSKLDQSHSGEGGNSLGNLWRRVMIMPPSNDDLQNIVKSWYPNLESLTERFIETFERIQSRNSVPYGSLSRFSLRDLLKWCKRIACFDFSLSMNGLSADKCHDIYQEAVDIFASFSASAENRLIMMKELAKMWAVPVSTAESLYPSHEPVIQKLSSEIKIGRVTLPCSEKVGVHEGTRKFVNIRSSLHVLEKIACSVNFNEPVLLVGETGTGKTTLVQNLAMMLGQRLTVLNLSQQSDVADLLGGFKPMDARFICTPLYKEFEYLFSKTFSMMENNKIFSRLQKLLSNRDWKKLLKGLCKYVDDYKKGKKRKKSLDEEWEKFSLKLETACRQIASSGMIFSFVEGAFVNALRQGEWILLDEVNLAPPETLQRIIGVLEGDNGSLCLAERGDVSHICRHPEFRIFACMNPATDAGKRDLPYSLRSRFTEFFVDDVLDDKDLELFIERFLGESRSNREMVEKIRCFYKAAKKESEEMLQDGANQKPQYSLRSLYRALEFTRKAEEEFGFEKALYDGFCMFFLTLLDGPSAKIMKQMIGHWLVKSVPASKPFDAYLIIKRGISMSDDFLKNYVLTKSVKEHLSNLARAILIKRYPILLQGPTSSGKTSLVKYLAALTGHEFVRINNHEHTDIQEYLGSYITDACGRLVFHEGVLVKAVRNGHWIVLDELNLAPSDVLEALNRLLDDNRELFVPELSETIKAHPDFMLFATQNPPTLYGGRKMLSRAFRNRFVEIHVDEIPENELSTILEKRCEIPETYAKKMVEVMKELQLHRQSSKVFAGKHGFITPRDLFRWANRFKAFGKSYEDLARDGYYLLAERLRDEGEKCEVQEVLEKNLRVRLVKDDLYPQEPAGSDSVSERLGNVVWTKSMWRLYFLVKRCYELREPVLLVGETGGGKTSVCQLLSLVLGSKLHILNCHQYTETSDFIGGYYPFRDRSRLMSEFKHLIEQKLKSELKHLIEQWNALTSDSEISSDIGQASSTLDKLAEIIKYCRGGQISCAAVTLQDLDSLEQLMLDVKQLHQRWQTIFMWHDGPLVQAMKDGSLFLADEISLADDSVLERLNSVLEPERKLSLVEKGASIMENVTAHENFFVLATMNPGGDYGKKELSPALRNRFTEIWVPSVSDLDELGNIALQRIANPRLSILVGPMLSFWEWFSHLQTGRTLTVRDLLSWVAFINVTERSLGATYALLHGIFLILLDGLSLGTGISKMDAEELRKICLSFLLEQLKEEDNSVHYVKLSSMENYGWGDIGTNAYSPCSDGMQCDNIFGIDPFYIENGDEKTEFGSFDFSAPTTRRNALRVLRAMQLSKPVLLEGSPGVGKTSLIVALGKYSGHKVVRINLSEQTDIMDLLGSDLPAESDEGMKFAWSDGILLQAIKEGCWVLLDEINLAPQSVLEGLNAILDHRGEVFIPELGLTFRCPSSFRVFACQNPSYQGGGRKGLPRSFLNRFTKVYVDELVENDYLSICSSRFQSIPRSLLLKLVLFNKRLHEETVVYRKFAQDGSPWEFNLRDVTRSCQILEGAPEKIKCDYFLNILYLQRMRTADDRQEVIRLYEEIFGTKPFINPYPRVQLNPQYLVVGNTAIKRNYAQCSKVSSSQLKILPGIRHSLEAAAHCIKEEWLCILVGPPSSGKTSLIRLLAQLTGNILNELNLSSATDISELLGCFEQYNAFRSFRMVVAQVESYVNKYCSLQLESSVEAIIVGKKELISRWLSFLSTVDFSLLSSSRSAYAENWKRISNSLCLLVEIIEKLRLDLGNNGCEELDRMKKTILKLQDNLKLLQSAKFEWVTGSLIKAIENGEWIVLENANLCNPTVLDRINSLVEPSGTITINERGTVDGKPVVLRPHPNFRMFLTVNPSYGEVSRAMRNRGVEIYMMPPYWLFDKGSGFTFEDSELKDANRFLVLSGIPGGKLVESMSRAHVYARVEGLRLNKSVTYLELARWVQLFQRLLTNGNQPKWSLQISWEHTYLSSLGVGEGENIIEKASNTYLSMIESSESASLFSSSLCMPGGWPMPLKLRDFIWYSKETSVRQNCMYLEFLGSQFASGELENCWNGSPVDHALTASNCSITYLLNAKMLQSIMFPKISNRVISSTSGKREYHSNLTNKMLLFAANWAIEQATESDFQLHLLWFSWFSSQLRPYHQFFNSFLISLKKELEDQIWKDLFRLHRKLTSLYPADLDLHPIPVLSMELVDLTASDDMSKVQLCNAIKCVDLLRLSYQQWNAENEHDYSDESEYFQPFLDSVKNLEKQVLKMLVKSPSFDKLLQLCTVLLEDHILFWNGVTSSKFDFLLISWRSLMKDARRLHDFCPREVQNVLMEGESLAKVSSWHFHSERSLLWVHGGHPFLPQSAKLYHQQHQLLKLCESLWQKQVNDCLVDVVVSSNPEFRYLALQGLCMSSHIACKSNEDDLHIAQQLEEVNLMLMRRFEYEKRKLEANLERDRLFDSDLASCCVFHSEVLCKKPGYDSSLDTLPINDSASWLLDMELLQELSPISMVDHKEMQLALGSVSHLLESALKYSLTASRRPPQTFVPHQKLLWMLDAWTSVDAVDMKVASLVLEMWFWWHSFLWSYHPASLMSLSSKDNHDIPLPQLLIKPVKTAVVFQILQSIDAIKDYSVYCLKLKVASRKLWESPPPKIFPSSLLSVARSLFNQIIYAHKKSFDAGKFAEIKSMLCAFGKSVVTQDSIRHLNALIASSSHRRLKSLVNLFIEPLLQELYLHCSPIGFHANLGFAWLWIGGLRFHLLLSCDDLDPAMKYSWKCSQLEEKISLLKLEIKVRQECDYLSGWSPSREAEKKRAAALQMLEVEQKRLQRKIVFRPDPMKFKALKKECDEFLELVNSSTNLVKNIEVMDLQNAIQQVCNWQETASSFICRLSEEYPEFIDLAQPVQVAVYEMKLGLSIVLSSNLQKVFLERIDDDMNQVMESLYSFMRFPRAYGFHSDSVNFKSRLPECYSHDLDFSSSLWEMYISFLEKMVTFQSDINAAKGSVLQLRASIYQNALVRVAHSVANSRLMDKGSFMLLDKIFCEFVSIWMNMKDEVKTKENHNAQQYKFRPRAFKVDRVFEVEKSSLRKLFASDAFSEWQELLLEEEFAEELEADDEHESLEEEWNIMQESILDYMIYIHNQLFGSTNLILSSGTFQISDAERLLSFSESYILGLEMMKGLEGLFTSTLDAKLAPEHLLRICLEHEKIVSSNHSARKYNFYKDSNAPVMAKMVKSLTTLQQRVLMCLSEWEGHPGLQKILNMIEMLLAIPLTTPLAKPLSGLQILLHQVQMLQENGMKFPLSDLLEPITVLVSSWQRMEFESWPVLLDEVQEQYEKNAGKLWFPLFSVLRHTHSDEIAGYDHSTIHSLEEFIQTSSIGEFRKRLLLIFAFLGQFVIGRSLRAYSSLWQEENLKMLYNIFGFYVQFLPVILEHIGNSRRNIEKEVKELLKLCRWEHCMPIENLRRIRQKLRKLVQKYTELLQQPAMLILNQETAQKGLNVISIQGLKAPTEISDMSEGLLSAVLDLPQFNDEERCTWYGNWRIKISDTLQKLQLQIEPELCFLDAKGISDNAVQWLASQSENQLYAEEWKGLWKTLENICRSAMDSSCLWKDLNKSVGKKRAFSELLKLLESSGLHKHKYEIMKISGDSNWLFLQPSYDAQHLLLAPNRLSHAAANVSAVSEIQCLPDGTLDTEWKAVNEFYFKSLASVQLLQQICLKHHHDFTSEQTSRSVSFLNHLLVIQQMQRDAAYDFAKHLKQLHKCVSTFGSLYPNSTNFEKKTDNECSFAHSRHETIKCIWQQKELFDSLYAMLVEESLLLRTVESTHLSDCQSVRVAARRVLSFSKKFIPVIQKSKESLDNYLLGPGGAITVMMGSFHHVISEQIESLVFQNFQVINEFGEHLSAFRKEDFGRSSVVETLLSLFDDLLKKGKRMAEQFNSALEARSHSTYSCEEVEYCNGNSSDLEAQFGGAITRMYENIMDMLQKLGSMSNDHALSEESLRRVTSWEYIYKSSVSILNLDRLNDQTLETISFAEKLVNHHGRGTPSLSSNIGTHLKYLCKLLELVLNFSDGFLQDFLAMHKTTSVVTHALANILASLFSKGFGISAKDQEDDASHDLSQDGSGTGMGEGAGVKDVSDQIDDEDQLLGNSEKAGEEQDASDKVPSKDDKGIEMEQDFAADTYSVSEDSCGEDNDENGEDEQLESAMGETGANSEVINEKLWDKEEEENPSSAKEKYESGPSVRDRDESSRELKAKEDFDSMADEQGELDSDATDGQKDETRDQEDLGDAENTEDLSMDKEEAFADPTGLKLDESRQNLEEDTNMDEIDSTDTKEEVGPEEPDESAENGNHEEMNKNSVDEIMEEADSEQAGGTSEKDDANGDAEENTEMNLTAPRKDVFNTGMSESTDGHVPNAESATQPNVGCEAFKNVAPEANWSNGNDIHNEITPLTSLPSNNTSQMDVMVCGSSASGKPTDDIPKSQVSHQKASPVQKTNANPYRNIGDALEEWKERVNVSVDLQADNTEMQGEVEDENADEYGYVSEFDKGTAQALGPATSEQIDKGGDTSKSDADNPAEHKNDITEMEIEKQNSEAQPIEHRASVIKNRMEQTQISDLEESPVQGSPETQRDNDGYPGSLSESLVSIKKSYLSEELNQLSKLSVSDNEPGKALELGEVSDDLKNNANALWRRYELQTTRLSQELAEQLRLVMEPTLASKLQGDYKTGKRINMKKVIPYIASHYRKDKIWLRRTRPNKRDYQVVIAVDDSRSMSESGCGDVAIEALVTVCRAMSQLEMGNLSVVSFGKKGNVRSLHDFDEPFTGVAGIKMMSGLTFKQENTIADEPVVDLLMFLNNMLDTAVAKARLPSGQNPLQQLVLIIGDGRFHEKENLKRWVRDLLSKKRMVAFLLVDSPEESIVDLKELSFQGKEIKVSNYLDSFPFPYYIVLKNIEALPRTLADLLRQWFELMQYTRE